MGFCGLFVGREPWEMLATSPSHPLLLSLKVKSRRHCSMQNYFLALLFLSGHQRQQQLSLPQTRAEDGLWGKLRALLRMGYCCSSPLQLAAYRLTVESLPFTLPLPSTNHLLRSYSPCQGQHTANIYNWLWGGGLPPPSLASIAQPRGFLESWLLVKQ